MNQPIETLWAQTILLTNSTIIKLIKQSMLCRHRELKEMGFSNTTTGRASIVAFVMLITLLALLLVSNSDKHDTTVSDTTDYTDAGAALHISQTDIDFNSVPLGETAVKSITLKNNDLVDSVTVNSLFLDEHDSLYYSVNHQPPLTIAAQQSIELLISFRPT